MKKITPNLKRANKSFFRCLVAVLVLVIVVSLINIIPKGLTRLDASVYEVFNLSDASLDVLDSVSKDVTIYTIAEAGDEDATLQTLLERYAYNCDNIVLKRVNPVTDPQFLHEHDASVSSGSIVIECENRSRSIELSDMYIENVNSSTGSDTYRVQMEKMITNAIAYVLSEYVPKVYTLVDSELSFNDSGMRDCVEGQNMTLTSLEIEQTGKIPDDADMIIINGVVKDLSDKATELLLDFTQEGGSILFIMSSLRESTEETPNIDAIMDNYGLKVENGIVIDSEADYFEAGEPTIYIQPDFTSHEITDKLIDDEKIVKLYTPDSIKVNEEIPESVTVDLLLTSSAKAYFKERSGSMVQQQDDPVGIYNLAVASTNKISDTKESKIVVISSQTITNKTVDEEVENGNTEFLSNTLNWLAGYDTQITIDSKQLTYFKTTMENKEKMQVLVIFVLIVPVILLGYGVTKWYRRRKQ